MLINSGYWNYYLAFRIKDYAKHIEEIKRKNNFSGMLAYITDDTVLTNINTDDLLRERKANIIKAQNELTGNESYEALYELYQVDKLPEYFFDYDNSLNDLLEEKIADSISRVRFANHGYQQTLHSFGKGKCEYYVLMPLKVYFTDSSFPSAYPKVTASESSTTGFSPPVTFILQCASSYMKTALSSPADISIFPFPEL